MVEPIRYEDLEKNGGAFSEEKAHEGSLNNRDTIESRKSMSAIKPEQDDEEQELQ